MNSLVVFNIFIVSVHLSIFVSLTTSFTGPGNSACIYLGETGNGDDCHKKPVKIKKLPKDCTSLFYDGVICNDDYNIEPKNKGRGPRIIKSLIKYKKRPVYAYFSHGSSENWNKTLFQGDFLRVANSLNEYRKDTPLKGLILSQIDMPLTNGDGKDFYQKFAEYVKVIREKNSDLEIGMSLSARNITVHSCNVTGLNCTLFNSTGEPWFDFPRLNTIVDYYIIEFITFNQCPINKTFSTITPRWATQNPNALALIHFEAALKNSSIPKNQIYFEFTVNPTPIIPELSKNKACELSYNEYCEDDRNQVCLWCADDTEILHMKGFFTYECAQGFVARYIDLVDRDNRCGCGKYMSFLMMINGFQNKTYKAECKMFAQLEY